MKSTMALMAATAMTSLMAQAADTSEMEVKYKPLRANYAIYSGLLGEQAPPTRSDRKLAIEIIGPAARDIFDSIYPDAKVKCSSEPGERLRSKGNLWCSFLPGTGYRCFLGYDLRSGKDIPGASC